MLHGLPTCKHCMTRFSNWRTFRTHVERGCQALFAGPLLDTAAFCPGASGPWLSHWMPTADAVLRGTRAITSDELNHLKTQSWGASLLQMLDERVPERVLELPMACQHMAKHCIVCGIQIGAGCLHQEHCNALAGQRLAMHSEHYVLAMWSPSWSTRTWPSSS